MQIKMKTYKVTGYVKTYTPITTTSFKAKNKKEAIRKVKEGKIEWNEIQAPWDDERTFTDLEATEE